VERVLAAALAGNDGATYFRVLSAAELYLPRFLSDPEHEPRLLAVELFGLTFIPVFTSAVGLATMFRDVVDGCAVTSYAELRDRWPDPEWRLAVNPGTPIDAYVRIEAVAAAATGEVDIPMTLDAVAADMALQDGQPAPPTPDVALLLRAAAERADVDGYVRVLLGSLLTVPTTRDVSDPGELFQPSFPWARKGDLIEVFTSVEAYRSGADGGGPSCPVAGGHLVAAWPPGCSLSLDPGSAHGIVLTEDQVRALVLWPDGEGEAGGGDGRG
jgi:hypothetical protein